MRYLDTVREALVKARSVFAEHGPLESHSAPVGRGASGDLSYDLDRRLESAVLATLGQAYPSARFFSEEVGILGLPEGRPVILLDPLDGSTNAVRGIPFFSTALAIASGPRFRDVEAAGVIDLTTGVLYLGERGGGLQVNGRRGQLSTQRDLRAATVTVGITLHSNPEGAVRVQRLLQAVRYSRFLGSAALETVIVGSGQLDAFMEPNAHLRVYDCLPSLFLAAEAGAYVRPLNFDLDTMPLITQDRLSYLAAGNPQIGEQLLGLMR